MRFSTWFGRHARITLALSVTLLLALSTSLVAFAADVHISTDPFTQATCAGSATTNHHANVEPDSFSNGATIVATFQVGRIFDGGACAIGFATSTNNGATWTSGLLPGLTKYTGGGTFDRATDAAVAYDALYPRPLRWIGVLAGVGSTLTGALMMTMPAAIPPALYFTFIGVGIVWMVSIGILLKRPPVHARQMHDALQVA